MKPLIFWSILAMLLMIGCPWLAATFAGSAGMAVCLLLFFGVNPIFSAVCGVFAGKDIKRLWPLPIVVAGLFLAGAWLFFAMGETAFFVVLRLLSHDWHDRDADAFFSEGQKSMIPIYRIVEPRPSCAAAGPFIYRSVPSFPPRESWERPNRPGQ